MRINKNTIDILLALDDEKLAYIVGTVLRESGIDVSEFGISGNDISALRKRLSELSDEELSAPSAPVILRIPSVPPRQASTTVQTIIPLILSFMPFLQNLICSFFSAR